MISSRFCFLFAILLLTSGCAAITGGIDEVERDEFLYKLPLMNEQVLGSLKYDDPSRDLRTLTIKAYDELLGMTELVEDGEEGIDFIQKSRAETKFHILQNTFLVCLHSETWGYLLCDDAATPGGDRVEIGKDLPPLESSYEALLETRSR
ncbi:hypothetical protein [Desulfuromonas sp. TF]|uniref:hypothetical protein n=1 Tax=Desulfuromonas sp. TF TaxID=1232410 RepID=UPI000482DF05|nr:hypothetical protein [Desulfuromonas sp. TF]